MTKNNGDDDKLIENQNEEIDDKNTILAANQQQTDENDSMYDNSGDDDTLIENQNEEFDDEDSTIVAANQQQQSNTNDEVEANDDVAGNDADNNILEGTLLQEIISKYDSNVEVDHLAAGIDVLPKIISEKLIKKRKQKLPENQQEHWETNAFDVSQLNEENSKNAILSVVKTQLAKLRRKKDQLKYV